MSTLVLHKIQQSKTRNNPENEHNILYIISNQVDYLLKSDDIGMSQRPMVHDFPLNMLINLYKRKIN